MIDGYSYVTDIGRVEIRVQEQANAYHFLLTAFTENNTTRGYRITWKKELGKFLQCSSYGRFRNQYPKELSLLTEKLMNGTLYTWQTSLSTVTLT